MDAQTIDEVILRLDEITATAAQNGGREGYFAALYGQVTRAVRDRARSGAFTDGAYMERLDVIFANRYFTAYDAWRAAAPMSRSWGVAFSACARPDLTILQHLMLGMNAHINLDLGVAVVHTSLPIEPHRADFSRLNDILLALLPKVQATLDEVSPMLDVVDRLGQRFDEAIAGFSMKVARAEAWDSAEDIVRSPDRARAIDRLDRRVALLSRGIADPLPPFGQAFGLVRAVEDQSDVARILALIQAVELDG